MTPMTRGLLWAQSPSLCGQRWLDHKSGAAAEAPEKSPAGQPPLLATIDGRWHRVRLRVLAATWCAT